MKSESLLYQILLVSDIVAFLVWYLFPDSFFKSTSKAVGGSTTRLIIKAADNKTDPNSFISVFKFEVKGKERRYQLAETGTLSKTESNNLSSVEYKAKKYGESSYYIVLEDLTAGEYGIVIGDPNHENTKNAMKVTTFTVE